eukprot:Sdes_comp20087_c0_seq4m13035
MASFWKGFLKLLLNIRIFLSLHWGRFIRWSLPQLGASTPLQHKIIVLGDGYASGFGDWVVLGHNSGICGYLEKEIAAKENIRQKWYVRSCGVAFSTSSDWIEKDKVFFSASLSSH